MNERAVERLAKLLEVERAALLAGDLETVGALMDEKETLTATLESAETADLQGLSAALMRNGTLLKAAHDGVCDVLSTLRDQRNARSSLSSYDSTGKATKIAQPKPETERRF